MHCICSFEPGPRKGERKGSIHLKQWKLFTLDSHQWVQVLYFLVWKTLCIKSGPIRRVLRRVVIPLQESGHEAERRQQSQNFIRGTAADKVG
jgi:hypothetical protein